VFGVAAIASFADPDAAAWVNGAAADILDTEKTVEDFLGKALPWNW
jgi:2-methylcitrate dehydratase PrpD